MSARVDPILALLLSPFVGSAVLLIGLAIYVASRVDRKHRAERAARVQAYREARDRFYARNRARENELTLAYIADVQRLEQATTVETARLRAGESA